MLGSRRSGLGVVWGQGHACGVANSKLVLVLLLFIAVEDTPHRERAPYDGLFLKNVLRLSGNNGKAAESVAREIAREQDANNVEVIRNIISYMGAVVLATLLRVPNITPPPAIA